MPTSTPETRAQHLAARRPNKTAKRRYKPEVVRGAFAYWHAGDESADGEQRAYCPLCEDPETSSSASASINAAKGNWNCLKGEHGGSIWDLVEVLKKQPGGFRISSSMSSTPQVAIPASPSIPPPLVNQNKPTYWHDQMIARYPERLEYLTSERGLSVETVSKFKLGWDGKRFTIPISYQGKWVAVRRYLPDGDPKIMGMPGHGSAVLAFTERLAGNTLPVILCEGEFDALLTGDKGEGFCVALTGTGGANTPPRDLSMLSEREVFVAYDCDKAGREGAEKIARAARKAGGRVHILDLTRLGLAYTEHKGEDLSDFFLKHGGTIGKLRAEMKRVRDANPERFKTVSAAELAGPVPAMQWLVQGVWPEGSYGTLAGEKKTLKTYTGLSLALAVASGEPFLGKFAVPVARPVLMYLGEGGQIPTQRRLQRIAAAMDVDLASLPLRMVFDAGDITGDEFLTGLKRAVDDLMPGLVIVDPFYAYHPAGVEAQNLYDRGAMLAEVQASMPAGCAFVLADHFRKTGGKDLDLDSIAQSGVAQWADSWILQNHDTPPQVDEGQFSIGMQFGSRQWGGQQYTVDWSIGAFSADDGEHEGALSVDVRAVGWGAKTSKSARVENMVEAQILTLLDQEPLVHTETSAREVVVVREAVGKARFKTVWDELIKRGRIVSEVALGKEGKMRPRWRQSTDPSDKLHLPKRGSE